MLQLSQTQIKLPESKNENATNYNFQKILLAFKAGRRMLIVWRKIVDTIVDKCNSSEVKRDLFQMWIDIILLSVMKEKNELHLHGRMCY